MMWQLQTIISISLADVTKTVMIFSFGLWILWNMMNYKSDTPLVKVNVIIYQSIYDKYVTSFYY